MQEHIKRLAVEAGWRMRYSNDTQLDKNDVITDGVTLIDLQNIVQAVARECAQVADDALTKGRSPMGKVAANAISARFGLEGL